MLLQGKLHQAVRWVTGQDKGGLLQPNSTNSKTGNTINTVEKVASHMQGTSGPGGVDSIAWQDWLLRFGEASWKFHKAVAHTTHWLANT
eukprot:8550659-Ditylum_brightwellii.AAC.1